MEHARSFYEAYPGNDLPPFEELVNQSAGHKQTMQTVDVGLLSRLDECQALQLAMKLEKEVEGNLREMAAKFKSPAAKAVVEKNVESTANHYEMIVADYERLYSDCED